MKKQGKVVRWEAERGFGFIRSPGTSAEVFFHLRDFRGPEGHRPRVGLEVNFDEIHVGGKGPRGMAVQPAGWVVAPAISSYRQLPVTPRRHPVKHLGAGTPVGSGAAFALPLMGIWAAAVLWGVGAGRLPAWALGAAAMVNLLAFFAYWQDKYAAQKRRWRISETTLHLWSLAGGWPGAWCAQQVLRHKSRKASFRETYWVTVLLNCAALGGWLWWLWPQFMLQNR